MNNALRVFTALSLAAVIVGCTSVVAIRYDFQNVRIPTGKIINKSPVYIALKDTRPRPNSLGYGESTSGANTMAFMLDTTGFKTSFHSRLKDLFSQMGYNIVNDSNESALVFSVTVQELSADQHTGFSSVTTNAVFQMTIGVKKPKINETVYEATFLGKGEKLAFIGSPSNATDAIENAMTDALNQVFSAEKLHASAADIAGQ
jgi:hypothetical protein